MQKRFSVGLKYCPISNLITSNEYTVETETNFLELFSKTSQGSWFLSNKNKTRNMATTPNRGLGCVEVPVAT